MDKEEACCTTTTTAVKAAPLDEAEEVEVEAGEMSSTRFRIQAQRVHLTYKTHLDKKVYEEWIKRKTKAKTVHMAHETADKHHPYAHTHVIVEWETAFQTKDCRRFDYEDIHPHIKPIKTKDQLEHTYRYLTKEDPECAYLLEMEHQGFARRTWACKTLQEALETCNRPSDVLGTITMFKNKPRPQLEPDIIEEFRPWQHKLLVELKGVPDDRHILWVYDPRGGAGKSRLARHIEDTGMGILISGTTSLRDVAFIIKTAIDNGENLGVVVVDLTRSFRDRDIYNLLEMLKNGRMVSPKYESARLRWRPGHVVVFANFLPQHGACSQDRWWIREVSQGETEPSV